MPSIHRSALVEQSAERMFDLVNDVVSYPSRFSWCDAAEVIEESDERMVARLDLGLGALHTWFKTENLLRRPSRIDMQLRDGPFKRLHGIWEFQPLDDNACKVGLTLDFEPSSPLLGPVFKLGFQSLADRMVNDFVRVASQSAGH
ncbi:MAG: type II toxin-antitoxin system RatA family toxin [Xanthomonadaceae bacterium]|jgi:ribosome-associated toxin RatA of RatAB toxin-antitoxin module|nr:type II toxin-antitoxin system RatA family toxin [Xanthomonadaceae bacterium]